MTLTKSKLVTYCLNSKYCMYIAYMQALRTNYSLCTRYRARAIHNVSSTNERHNHYLSEFVGYEMPYQLLV